MEGLGAGGYILKGTFRSGRPGIKDLQLATSWHGRLATRSIEPLRDASLRKSVNPQNPPFLMWSVSEEDRELNNCRGLAERETERAGMPRSDSPWATGCESFGRNFADVRVECDLL